MGGLNRDFLPLPEIEARIVQPAAYSLYRLSNPGCRWLWERIEFDFSL
jgi:hypothetical protein